MNLHITPDRRKEMEKLIYDTFDALDPTGTNTTKYQTMFQKMSMVQFINFFTEFFADPDQFLILEVIDYERDLNMEQIEDAAKVLKIPLFERIIMPHINKDLDNPVLSKEAVPVGYVPLKRMQQMLAKKNTTSTNASMRSALTGQVVGKDKNARDSDTENFSLVTIDADDTLREFMGPRSDDMQMKSQMYSDIAQKGFVSLDTIPSRVENKTTLNSVDTKLISMGLKTNLITDGLVLKKTLDN